MRNYIVISIVLVCLCGNGFAAISGSGFERYDEILSRKPFGVPPVAPVVSSSAMAPAVPVESFAKNIRMIAVTDDDLGVRVGLYDMKDKRSFFIGIGDSSDDGIQLVEANFDEGAATLKKGDEVCTVYIDGKGGSQPASTGGERAVAGGVVTGRAAVPSMTGPVHSSSRTKMISYMERRRLRKEQEAKEAARRIEEAAEKRVSTVDKEKMIREYNMELIRAKGAKGKPLPMELTPEEDDELVKEGVLPPR